MMKISMRKFIGISLASAALLSGCGKPTAEKLISDAHKAEAKGDVRAALVNLKGALQEQPDNLQARLQLAALYLRTGEIGLADIELGKAEAQKAEPSKILELRARSAFVARKYADVLALLSTEKAPFIVANPDLLALRGDALVKINKLPEAEQNYRDALKIEKTHLPSLLGLVRQANSAKQQDLVNQRLADAERLHPESADLELLRGDLALDANKLEAAAAAYQKAGELAPGRSIPFYNLALVNIQRQKLDEARKDIAQILSLEPSSRFARYLTASINFQEKKYDAAQSSIQELLKLIPDDPSARHLAASIAYEKGNYSLAENHMRVVLEKVPDNLQARYLMALIQLKLKKPDQAIVHLQTVMKKAPNSPAFISAMGDAMAMKGEFSLAVAQYDRVVRLLPDNLMPKTKLAASYISTGDIARGLDELESVRQLQQTDELSASMLVLTAIKYQQFGRAQTAIDALLKADPKNPAALQLAAALALAKQDTKAERAYLEKAVAIKPDFFSAIVALANLDKRQGHYDSGKQLLESFASSNPKNIQAQLALAGFLAAKPENAPAALAVFERAYKLDSSAVVPAMRASQLALYLRDRNKALDYAQRAVASDAESAEALENLGLIQMGLGDTHAALSAFTKLVGLKPKSPIAYVHLAKAQVLLGDEASARGNLEKALALDPNFISAQKAMLASLMRAKKMPEALAFARRIQQLKPSAMFGYSYEGDVWAKQKRFADAAKSYQQSLQLYAYSDTALKLHSVRMMAGNVKEADADLARWLQQHPREQIVQHYLAESYMRQANWKLAIAQYQLILGMYPRDIRALNNLANSFMSAGDLAAARSTIEKAESFNAKDAEVLDTHASILAASGDAAGAMNKVDAALERDANNPNIRLHRAQLLIAANKSSEARKELERLRSLGDKFPAQAEVKKLLGGLK